MEDLPNQFLRCRSEPAWHVRPTNSGGQSVTGDRKSNVNKQLVGTYNLSRVTPKWKHKNLTSAACTLSPRRWHSCTAFTLHPTTAGVDGDVGAFTSLPGWAVRPTTGRESCRRKATLRGVKQLPQRKHSNAR